MVPPVLVHEALPALFLDVGEFAVRGQLAITADDTAAGKRREPEQSDEPHRGLLADSYAILAPTQGRPAGPAPPSGRGRAFAPNQPNSPRLPADCAWGGWPPAEASGDGALSLRLRGDGSWQQLTAGVNLATLWPRHPRRQVPTLRNKLYTIPSCPHCPVARAYLLSKGVDFVEFDVSTDVEALRAMLTMTARPEVPTIVAGDRAVVGFNPQSWDALLERSAELQREDPYEIPESLGADPYRGVD